jgi:hypothetical protein
MSEASKGNSGNENPNKLWIKTAASPNFSF